MWIFAKPKRRVEVSRAGFVRVFGGRLVAVTLLSASAMAGDLTLMLGDFENGSDGFDDTIQRDTSEFKLGHASGRLVNKDQEWVGSGKGLPDLERDFREVRVWYKAAAKGNLCVRLLDAQGQYYLHRVELPNDSEWHEYVFSQLNEGESWGGPKDGQWHGPAQEIALILEGHGTVWVDGLQAELSPELAPAAKAHAERVSLAKPWTVGDFEEGTDGFTGAVERDSTQAKTGKGSIRICLNAEGFAEAARELPGLQHDFVELSFWARAEGSTGIGVRLVDSAGHNYLQRFPLMPDGMWHPIRIRRFNTGESWGGPADKQWVAPAKNFVFVLESKGTVWIDGVTALLDAKRIVPGFAVTPRVLGNVFVEGEPVEIVVDTSAEKLAYRVQDFWGKTVAEGAAVPDAEHRATLCPALHARGQFEMHVTAWAGGKKTVHEVDFAVIEPIVLAALRESPFGVMTHFSQGWKTDLVPLIARVGFPFVRDETPWDEVEQRAGEYNFNRFTPYLDALTNSGIRPLLLMTYDNPLYDGGNTPYTPAGRAAFGRYGQEILKRFGDRMIGIEIWNEYNGSWCKGPAAENRPKSQAELCQAVYPLLKQARRDITVLGGAAVLLPLPYYEGVFKNGGLKGMDAVVIHPYRSRPEGLDGEIGELREVMKQHLQGQEKPLWATEYGSFSPEPKVSARFYVRLSTLMLSQGVRRMVWYLMQDHREFANMGIVHGSGDLRGAYSPAPALGAAAAAIRLLHDARYAGREATRRYSRAFVFKFLKGNDELRVCWATYPARIRLQADGPVARIDLMGNPQPVALKDGCAELPLDDTPFYLRGAIKSLVEVATESSVVADLCDDFSRVQGANGWTYGYFDGTEPSGPYTDADFKPFTLEVTPWGDHWRGPQDYLGASRGEFHPQVKDNRAVWSVARWKSSVSGMVTIEGTVERGREGDGTTFVILVGGRKAYERHVGGPKDETKVAFSVQADVRSGTLVDFAVTPGPDNNIANDSTTVDTRVIAKDQ